MGSEVGIGIQAVAAVAPFVNDPTGHVVHVTVPEAAVNWSTGHTEH